MRGKNREKREAVGKRWEKREAELCCVKPSEKNRGENQQEITVRGKKSR